MERNNKFTGKYDYEVIRESRNGNLYELERLDKVSNEISQHAKDMGLLFACRRGDANVFDLLIKWGADASNEMCLFNACENSREIIVDKLLPLFPKEEYQELYSKCLQATNAKYYSDQNASLFKKILQRAPEEDVAQRLFYTFQSNDQYKFETIFPYADAEKTLDLIDTLHDKTRFTYLHKEMYRLLEEKVANNQKSRIINAIEESQAMPNLHRKRQM